MVFRSRERGIIRIKGEMGCQISGGPGHWWAGLGKIRVPGAIAWGNIQKRGKNARRVGLGDRRGARAI